MTDKKKTPSGHSEPKMCPVCNTIYTGSRCPYKGDRHD